MDILDILCKYIYGLLLLSVFKVTSFQCDIYQSKEIHKGAHDKSYILSLLWLLSELHLWLLT